MESSILQQRWIQQEKQKPLELSVLTTRSNVPTTDEEFNQTANRTDVFSSASTFQINCDISSSHLLSPSSTNISIKEFCPIEKEEKRSSKRLVYQRGKAVSTIPVR